MGGRADISQLLKAAADQILHILLDHAISYNWMLPCNHVRAIAQSLCTVRYRAVQIQRPTYRTLLPPAALGPPVFQRVRLKWPADEANQRRAFCISLTLGAHAHESYCSLCVCLSVCYQSSASVRRSCDKMNLPDRSLLNSEGFELGDFAKKLSFPSYSSFFVSHSVNPTTIT